MAVVHKHDTGKYDGRLRFEEDAQRLESQRVEEIKRMKDDFQYWLDKSDFEHWLDRNTFRPI